MEECGDIDKYQLVDARHLAMKYLYQLGKERGMDDYLDDHSIFLEEQFNLIRGWDRNGRIFDIGAQVAPGLITEYQGVRR